jgi:hypothetical protein
MKESYINIHGDEYGRYYEVNVNGSYNNFVSYEDAVKYIRERNDVVGHVKYYISIDPWEESEEDKISRLAREKAEERESKINMLLGE